jgi:SHS2 domain-containing protein
VSWEQFEHQADIGLCIHGRDGAELFAEAGLALASLLCDPITVETRRRYALAGEAGSVEELLVGWLNDLVYLFEGERVVWCRIELPLWEPTRYRALLDGEPADPDRHGLRDVVKAATYHGLSVEQGASGWTARVILDV